MKKQQKDVRRLRRVVSITLSPEEIEVLDREARRHGRSRSAQIREWIYEHLHLERKG